MPPIPTYSSSATIQTGSTGPTASPKAFGDASGYQSLAAGLFAASQNAEQVAGVAYRLKMQRWTEKQHSLAVVEQKQNEDARAWVASNANDVANQVQAFMSDPKNTADRNALQNVKQLFDTISEPLFKSAPSTEAADDLRLRIDSLWRSASSDAAKIGEENRISENLMAFDGAKNASTAAYLSQAARDPAAALAAYKERVQQFGEDLQAAFPLSKVIVRKQQEAMARDMALAVARHDTKEALAIVEESQLFNQTETQSLKRQIESIGKTGDAVAESEFIRQFESSLNWNTDNLESTQMPSEETVGLFITDPDRAALFISQAKDRVNASNLYVADANEINGMSRAARANYMADRKSEVGNDRVKMAAFDLLSKFDAASRKLEDEDPVSFVGNNPFLSDLAGRISSTADEAERRQLEGQYRLASMRYQGAPPPGTPADEARYYLNRSDANIHILSKGEATALAERFQSGDLDIADFFTTDINERFGVGADPEERAANVARAVNDMIELPDEGKRLTTDYMAVFALTSGQNTRIAGELFGLLRNRQAIKDLMTDETFAARKDSILKNQDFIKYVKATNLNFSQGAPLQDSMANILAMYSIRLGNSRDAIERTINANFMFGDGNNDSMFIVPKYKADGTPRNESDLDGIDYGLSALIAQTDPNDILPTSPYGEPLWRPTSPVQEFKETQLRSILNSARWQTLPSGEGVALYGVDSFGPFELRRKDGSPLVVYFEEFDQAETVQLAKPPVTSGGFDPRGSGMWPAGNARKYYWHNDWINR